MSINKKRFSFAAAVCAEILLCVWLTAAQDLEANVKISAELPAIVQVSGRLLKQSKTNWFFLKSVANADNLGARVTDFQLFDRQNRAVVVKKLLDGEYLTEAEAVGFQYRINLAPVSNALTKAHVSWISGELGILMLDDLLPQISADNQKISAKIRIELPGDWKVLSSEKMTEGNVFDVTDLTEAVFTVGKNWRETRSEHLNLAISGEWNFSDAEAAQMANEIYERYRNLFGEIPNGKTQIVIAQLPKETKYGRWEAETRGKTLTIFSADKPFKSQSIQLLDEQLRHELFHLWIPNNLSLTGSYDWFYEGFTVYEALRTGLQMNQIRFEDFLATLAEAYNLDSFQTGKVSLLESSKNRWNGVNRQVYARGMLIAFLCDAAILRGDKKNRSIENVFQEIYRKHRFPNDAADGSTAILNALRSYRSLDLIVVKYVEGTEKIDWETDLQAVGIEAVTENSFVKLVVKAKLSGKQKDLLDELGYNNWRKKSLEKQNEGKEIFYDNNDSVRWFSDQRLQCGQQCGG